MKAPTARALIQDALYQVLDNKVFRLLTILVFVMILPTWVIGAREDELVILFGWRSYFYEDVFRWLNLPFPGLGRAHVQLIQTVQAIFVDHFAGKIGITFAVAATAFFVPRMLEKGAADTLFSKPLGRFTLLFSRYMAGLLFVALLAVVLVCGIHVGLLVNSGYSDPGFLWSILTLVYLFAILHAFSVTVGVITRSTVAAILTTLMFFLFTGCTHLVWESRDQNRDSIEEGLAITNESAEGADTFDRFAQVMLFVLDTAHYTLPKTNDATRIAKMLRQSLSGEVNRVRDVETDLAVLADPGGFERRGDFPDEPVEWSAAQDGERVKYRLERRQWSGPEDRDGQHRLNNWVRFMVGRNADELRAAVEADPAASDLAERRTRSGIWREADGWELTRDRVANQSTAYLTWSASGPDGERDRRAYLFGRWPEWIYVVEIDRPAAWADDPDRTRQLEGFLGSFVFETSTEDVPDQWYTERFDWDAELKYNAFFSLGSTLAFIAAIIALAGWRLSRIDF